MDTTPRKSILIVDDAFANRALLSRIFRDDYNVVEAEDGAKALLIMRSVPDIAAIVLDLVMPVLDGYGVLEEMRADERLCGIPVIVVTASGDEQSQIMALDRGAVDVITKPVNPHVMLHRVRNIINRKNADMLAEQNRMYRLRVSKSEMDEKSGICNKRGFMVRTAALLRENPDKRYVIVRWDIDRFKVYNDIYGAAAGDKLLADIGRAYRRMGFERMTYGRWEADHFVNCVPAESMDADGTSAFIAEAIAKLHHEFDFVTRMGLYEIDDPSIDIELMCDRALLALRSVKGSYTKRYAYYDGSMRAALIEEQTLTGDMDVALREGQFAVYFQPQYNYDSGAMSGAEALVRWEHPERGMIMPGVFIPLFERNGFVTRLDEYVWRRTCAYMREWIDKGLKPVPLSVNISRQDIYNPDLCDTLVGLTREYGLDRSMLRLEITETAYVNNPEQLIKVVGQLRDNGFYVEMDDFGSGYSSLNILKDVPVDMLKLDMRFLDPKDKATERSGSILSAVVRMTNMLGLAVLAEGVETREQADFLKSVSCIYMQGYFFAKPMPPEAFEKLLGDDGRISEAPASSPRVSSAVDFLNSASQEALIFNSFVGGAGILEYTGDCLAALRLNDRYFEVLGTTREDYIAHQDNLLNRFDEVERARIIELLDNAIATGKEAMSERRALPLSKDGDDIWLEIRMRFLAKKGDSYLIYISLENITERKRLEEHNLALNERLSALIDTVPGGIFTYIADDRNDYFSFISDTMLQMLGYTREEFVDKFDNRFTNMVWHEDRATALRKIKDDIERTGSIDTCEYRIETKSGKLKWVFDVGRLITNKFGIKYFIVVIVDNDEKKALELRLGEENAEMQNIIDSIPGGVATYELGDAGFRLRYASAGVAALTGRTAEEYEREVNVSGSLGIYPPDEAMIEPIIRERIDNGQDIDLNFRMPHKNGRLIWINLRGRRVGEVGGRPVLHAVYHNQSLTLELYRRILDESEEMLIVADRATYEVLYANAAAVRMSGDRNERYYGKTCYGLLFGKCAECDGCLAREMGDAPRSREFDRDGRHYFTRVTPINWNGRDAFINYLTDRTDAWNAQNKLETVLSNIPGGLVGFRIEKKDVIRIYLSASAFKILGYSEGERPIDSIAQTMDRVYPQDRPALSAAIEHAVLAREPICEDFRIIPSNGGCRWVNLTANPMVMDDGMLYFYGVYTDADMRKRQEQQALNEQRELQDIFRNTPGGVCRWRLQEVPCLDYVSDSYCALTGYGPDELRAMDGECIARLIAPEDCARMAEVFADMALYPQVRVYEYGLISKCGEKLSFRSTSRAAYGDDGVMRVYEQVYDVTALKRTEEALLIRNEEYRRCIEQSGMVIYRYTVKDRLAEMPLATAQKISVSASLEHMPEELLREGCVLPESERDWTDFFDRIDRGEDEGRAEVHMRLADGLTHWLSLWFVAIKGQDGRPVSAIVRTEDITEAREQAKNRAFERSSLFAALRMVYPMIIAANLTRNSYYMLEYDRYTTKRAESSGVYDELIDVGLGTVPEEDRHSFTLAFARGNMLEAFASGRDVVRLEHRQMGDDGIMHWIETTSLRVDNPYDGDILQLTLARPIDERKSDEEKLLRALETTSDTLSRHEYFRSVIKRNLRSLVEVRYPDETGSAYRLGSLMEAYGYTDEEFDALRLADDGSAREARDKAIAAMREGAPRYETEYCITTRSGAKVWISEHAERFVEKNGRSGYVAVSVDNTQNRKLLDRVRISEEEIKLAVARTGTYLARYDIATHSLSVPEPYAWLWDMPAEMADVPESMLGRPEMFCDDESLSAYRRLFERILSGEPEGDCELHLIRPGTGEAWEHTEYITIFGSDGRPTRAILSVTDTTEQHRQSAETETLKKNMLIMRVVAEHSGRIVYFFDHDTGKAISLQGAQSEESGLPESFTVESLIRDGTVSPESKDLLRSLFSRMREGHMSGDARLRMRDAEGAERWFELRFSNLREADAHATGAVLSFLDITEQHVRELAYARYLQIIAECGSERSMFFETDITADIVEKQGGDLLPPDAPSAGHSYNEMLAYLLESFFSPSDRVKAYRQFRRDHLLALCAEGERDMVDDWPVKYTDGSEHWARVSVQLVSDPYTEHVRALMIIRDITRTKERLLSVQRQAELDGLTGILNRVTAEKRITELLSEPRGRCALVMLDIDNLKDINDTMGHVQGDRALRAIGEELNRRFRSSDVVGRLGGDEYIIFLAGITGDDALRKLISSLLSRLSAISIGENDEWRIHCSIGCALGEHCGDDFATLYKRADLALYHVKRNGKNDYAFFTPDMEKAGYRYSAHEQTATIIGELFDPREMRKLLDVLSNHYPTVINVNLTRKTLRVMHAGSELGEIPTEAGTPDGFMRGMRDRVHPDDREALENALSHDRIAEARKNGESHITLSFRLASGTGGYMRTEMLMLFYTDDVNDDCLFALVRARD